MDLNYSTNLIFPVPIHQIDTHGFDEIKDELIDYAYNLKKEDEGVIISNKGGWQSKVFAVKENNDILHSYISHCISNFPIFRSSVEYEVFAWININKPGAYNITHDHPDSNLAGVLWIKCPENCGDIEFDNPNVFQTYREIESYDNEFKEKTNVYSSFYFTPVEGKLLVFPSHLLHKVDENKSKEDRISVSFNIRFVNWL